MSVMLQLMVSAQKAILFVCSLLIAVIFGIVVVLRYGFQMNLFAYEEWVLIIAFTLYFIGAAQGSHNNTHIKADILNDWIKDPLSKWRYKLSILILEIAVCAVLSYWGYQMFAENFTRYPDMPATIVYKIPLAVPHGIIFIGFILMTFYSTINLVRMIRDRPSGESEPRTDIHTGAQ